ncbi:hypothetical protein [uncultured Novosphingobium sp.]|uniref:hypothetical protein n=1 Tax=uncultured Novosphingobium sp. TaxID=292277 RepID=UPI003749E556
MTDNSTPAEGSVMPSEEGRGVIKCWSHEVRQPNCRTCQSETRPTPDKALMRDAAVGEVVAWLKEWCIDGEPRSRVDRYEKCEPWLASLNPKLTPLYSTPMPVEERAKGAALIEVERDENGKVLICSGCGTVETVRSIRARHPTAFTCCPERKMVPALAATNAPPTTAADDEARVEAVEVECARLLAAYLRKEIGRLMHQAEHWAKNNKPFAVHHRVMKADSYFQILVLMERDPAKGWKLPFDEIRDSLARPEIHAPGSYPPSKELHRYRDPEFVVAALRPQAPSDGEKAAIDVLKASRSDD